MATGAAKIRGLLQWCKNQVDGYPGVEVTNFTKSFRDGLAFCAIIHRYRPELIDFYALSKENVLENNTLAYSVAEKELGIPPLLDAEDMVAISVPDRLSIITYVSQYHNYFANKVPLGGPNVITAEPTRQKTVIASRNGDQSIRKRDPKSDVCAICKKNVYMLERYYHNDQLFHRNCLRRSQVKDIGEKIKSLERGAHLKRSIAPVSKLSNSVDDEDPNVPKRRTPSPAVAHSTIRIQPNNHVGLPVPPSTPGPQSPSPDRGSVSLESVESSGVDEITSVEPCGQDISYTSPNPPSSRAILSYSPEKSACNETASEHSKPPDSDEITLESSMQLPSVLELPNSRGSDGILTEQLVSDAITSQSTNPDVSSEVKCDYPKRLGHETVTFDSTKQSTSDGNAHDESLKLPVSVSNSQKTKEENNDSIRSRSQSPTVLGSEMSSAADSPRPHSVRSSTRHSHHGDHHKRRAPPPPPACPPVPHPSATASRRPNPNTLTARSSSPFHPSASSVRSSSPLHLPHAASSSPSRKSSSPRMARHGSAHPPRLPHTSAHISTTPSENEQYPENLNPFADEEPNSIQEEVVDEERKDETVAFEYHGKNPFDDDEEESNLPNLPSLPSLHSIPIHTPCDYRGKNPFDSESEDDAISNDLSSLGNPMVRHSSRRPKRHAPPPPPKKVVRAAATNGEKTPQCPEISPSTTTTDIADIPTTGERFENGRRKILKPTAIEDATIGCGDEKTTTSAEKTHLKRILPLEDSAVSSEEDVMQPKKGPAPSLPVVSRRCVRTDADEEHIPYSQLISELENLNEDQLQIEKRGQQLENELRDAEKKVPVSQEGVVESINVGAEVDALFVSWLELIEEKTQLFRKECELHYRIRQRELEERHADIEFELRQLLAKQDNLKSSDDKRREDLLLQDLQTCVMERSELVHSFDEDHQRRLTEVEAPRFAADSQRIQKSTNEDKHRTRILGPKFSNVLCMSSKLKKKSKEERKEKKKEKKRKEKDKKS